MTAAPGSPDPDWDITVPVTSDCRSVNTSVTDYPDEISKRAASVLSSASQFRFDASDLMPEQMNAAFLQAVNDYVHDAGNLDGTLAQLDDVQRQVNAASGPVSP